MAKSIKRHSLQSRITHGVVAISCILLGLSGLFVLVPALTPLLPAPVVFAIRMGHRIIGVIMVAVPIVSAIASPKGVKRLAENYFTPWTKDDIAFMKKFVPYMLSCKKVHMPNQDEIKSGQRIADGLLILSALVLGVSGIIMIFGTSGFGVPATVMNVSRFLHDLGFILIIVFGLAHIYLGSGIFQPYRGTIRAMFGDGYVSESDALYHWGHWARKELISGENVKEDAKQE